MPTYSYRLYLYLLDESVEMGPFTVTTLRLKVCSFVGDLGSAEAL